MCQLARKLFAKEGAMNKRALKKALKQSIPILCSYVFISMAYGMLMAENGYPWYVALLASVIVYTGAFQFVLVSLLAGGASLGLVAVTALLMNSRQTFYALSFVDEFRSMGKKAPLMVHTLTDETYAVDCSLPRDLPERKNVLFLVAVLSYAYWILGTLLGAALGQILPWNLEGIDFCMTALFVVILMQQWEKTTDHFPALLGGGMALVCLTVLGPDRFMLPALLITSAILFVTRTGEVRAK